jgi:hypothetical protein
MVEVTSNISRSSDEDHLLVLGVFLIFGFLSGLMFGWLVSRPELQPFFYVKGNKFLIPRYSYWYRCLQGKKHFAIGKDRLYFFQVA